MSKRRFVPTPEQRAQVLMMGATRMTPEAMARTIINPDTGRRIDDETLKRAFKEELATAQAFMQWLVLSKFNAKLEEGHWEAVRLGMNTWHGIRLENGPLIAIGDSPNRTGINVTFVQPNVKQLPEDLQQPQRVIEHQPTSPTFSDPRLSMEGKPDWPPPPIPDNKPTHDNVTVLKPAAGQLNVNNADRVNNVNAPRGLGWMKS